MPWLNFLWKSQESRTMVICRWIFLEQLFLVLFFLFLLIVYIKISGVIWRRRKDLFYDFSYYFFILDNFSCLFRWKSLTRRNFEYIVPRLSSHIPFFLNSTLILLVVSVFLRSTKIQDIRSFFLTFTSCFLIYQAFL